MDIDNMIAGVSPGGFKDVYEVRILICYLLCSIQKPLSKEHLNMIIQDSKLVNYFTFSNALAELLNENYLTLLEQQGEEYYQLNSAGEDTAKMLQNALPRSVRSNVVHAALELLSRQKKERENEVTIEPHQQGFNVHFVIHDTDVDLLQFTLFVPDQLQADAIKSQFLKSPSAFYIKVISFLTKGTYP